MNTVSVLIADDHQILRQGLRGLLEKHPEFIVVAEAVNGREAVSLATTLAPDVVIIDIGMPDLNGIEATRRLLSERPATRVLGLSMHEDKRFITEMLRAGAMGYLLKDCAFEELALAIHTVLDGRIYLSPRINDLLLQEYVHTLQRGGGSAFTLLSSREREVLQLLAEGESVKVIAARLCISVKTVETHRQQIMDKVDIHSIAELTKYAIREGLTSLEG